LVLSERENLWITLESVASSSLEIELNVKLKGQPSQIPVIIKIRVLQFILNGTNIPLCLCFKSGPLYENELDLHKNEATNE